MLPSFYVFYHILEQQVKCSTKRSALCYQQDVQLAGSDLLSEQKHVLTNVLQYCEWFHQCKFLHNCIHLKFCMRDVNYLQMEKVILLSSLTILKHSQLLVTCKLKELPYYKSIYNKEVPSVYRCKTVRSNFVLLTVQYF